MAASERGTAALLFTAAFIGAMVQLALGEGVALGKGFETVAVAESLARQGTFADPFFAAPTGPTAHLPPLYPLLLAALMKLFGGGLGFAAAATMLNVAAQALHAALLPAVSRRLVGDPRPGIYGAALSILLPVFEVMPAREAMLSATALLLFALDAAAQLERPGREWRRGARLGVWAGLLILLNPALAVVMAPWLVYMGWRTGTTWPRALRLGAGFALAAVLVCTPWTVRNYRQFGRLVLVRDNLGLELYVANHDLAKPSFAESRRAGVLGALHANSSRREALALREMGEAAYNEDRLAKAKDWIRRNPQRFARLTAARIAQFWFPRAEGFGWYAYSLWIVTALSWAGLAVLVRRRAPTAWFVAAAWTFYPAVYYMHVSLVYFRYPTLWVSLIAAGVVLAALRR
jgi:hypothetical protein